MTHLANTVKELIPVYKEINRLILHKKYEDLDHYLKEAIESDCAVTKIGRLRLMFNCRHNLVYWNDLYYSTVKFLNTHRWKYSLNTLRGLEPIDKINI